MGKATLMTPLYVSVAWTMMITYQVFTQTAVSTVLSFFNVLWPAAGEWLLLRMDMVIFVYAFAWVFVLSSVIPSLLLGKKRSVLVQFFVCLVLAFVAFIVQDSMNVYISSQPQVLLGVAFLLGNPLLAVAYLSMPYVVMLAIDIRARRKDKKDEQLNKITTMYLERSRVVEQEAAEEEASVTDE
ncbi:MAG: hypothetical protein OEZ18_06565 [Candidatus Bathyarchaeota archaeon]|nr:hypothetical protein [Candidatus Bathyarchaeota archaeon]